MLRRHPALPTRPGRRALALLIPALLLLGPVVARGESPPLPQIGLEAFIQRATRAAAADPAARAALAAARDSVAVVFLPGILGSRLTRDGRVLWGKDAPNARDLALLEAPGEAAVTPAVLDEYGIYGLTRFDIYGEFDRALEQARNGRGLRLDFPYDWRQDPAASVEGLDAFLRGTPALRGKSLVLVGHSLGGVVAWGWQSRKARAAAADGLRVRRLLLLGAPLQGTCEMARLLLQGYQPIPGASRVEALFYGLLFGDLRPAALTFPSVFALLPPVPADPAEIDASCLEVPLGPEAADRVPGDYFSPAFWQTDLGRALLGAPWETLRLPEVEFFRRLAAALRAAEAFRVSLDLERLEVPTTFFYAADHPTTLKARVLREDGGGRRVEFPFVGPGDGRVPVASARNDGLAQGRRDMRRLGSTHGDLPKDPRFIAYLGQELGRLITAQVALEAARALLRDEALMDRYAAGGGGLLSTTALAASLGEGADGEVREAVDALNARILGRLGRRPTYAAVREMQNRVQATDPALQRRLTPLFEAALVEPGAVDEFNRTFALGRLGWALLDGGNPAAALLPLREAQSRVEQQPERYGAHAAFRAGLLSNLGVASLRTGLCADARAFLRRAGEAGSARARRALAEPCRDRETGAEG